MSKFQESWLGGGRLSLVWDIFLILTTWNWKIFWRCCWSNWRECRGVTAGGELWWPWSGHYSQCCSSLTRLKTSLNHLRLRNYIFNFVFQILAVLSDNLCNHSPRPLSLAFLHKSTFICSRLGIIQVFVTSLIDQHWEWEAHCRVALTTTVDSNGNIGSSFLSQLIAARLVCNRHAMWSFCSSAIHF